MVYEIGSTTLIECSKLECYDGFDWDLCYLFLFLNDFYSFRISIIAIEIGFNQWFPCFMKNDPPSLILSMKLGFFQGSSSQSSHRKWLWHNYHRGILAVFLGLVLGLTQGGRDDTLNDYHSYWNGPVEIVDLAVIYWWFSICSITRWSSISWEKGFGGEILRKKSMF